MTEQLPLLSGRQLIQVLNSFGYRVARQRSSHLRLTCPNRDPVTVPDYKEIDRSLIRKILRDANIDVDEFMKAAKALKIKK